VGWAPSRAQPQPRQEEDAQGQHAQAHPQVDVDALRLVDLRVGRDDPGDRDDDPVEDEQAADDPADVEEPRGGRRLAPPSAPYDCSQLTATTPEPPLALTPLLPYGLLCSVLFEALDGFHGFGGFDGFHGLVQCG